MRKLLLVVLLLVCCVGDAAAQVETRSVRERVRERRVQMRQRADSIIDAHRKVTTDTAYVARPVQPLTLRFKTDGFGNEFEIRGNVPERSIDMLTMIRADMKCTLGVTANYRGISVALSLNPDKLLRRTSNTEYNVNYYNNRYGADLTYSDIHEFSANTVLNGVRHSYDMTDTHLLGLSANVYYVFNSKRFSYPAVFNHSWIQKRSAGSLLVAASFYRADLKSDFKGSQEVFAGGKEMDMTHVSVGVGYGYNYVAGKHWLLHLSAQPSIMVWKNYTLSFVPDELTGETVKAKLPARFPEVYVLGRVGATYNWDKYFVGMTGVVQTSKVGRDYDFSLRNTLWKGRAYFGIRL